MPAPTFGDGIQRGAVRMGVPSVPLLFVVTLVREFQGIPEAGLTYLLGTLLLSVILIGTADFWNVPYTIGCVLGGFTVWIFIPGVFSEILPSIYTALGSLLLLFELVALSWLASTKR